MPEPDRSVINAQPTKEFFTEMLVRDIPLSRAIVDLVDNCVDGAMRLRGDGSFTDLRAAIRFDAHQFAIEDNCGGIPIPTARDYAFRFGRPEGAEETPGSIGKFGVGMKRALFKLGRQFEIESATPESRFTIAQDADAWIANDDWTFQFRTLEENVAVPADQVGTRIRVQRLYLGVSDQLADPEFESRLAGEIRAAHSTAVHRGLAITVNGVPIGVDPLGIFNDEDFQPIEIRESFDGEGVPPVELRIIAGVAKRSYSDGGWYVFMNGRRVLTADQTWVTGWGEGESTVIPRYHADYAYFRGYAFLTCSDAGRLPWTTTKTDLDTDDEIFVAVRQRMVRAMQEVIPFLKRVEDERSELGEDAPLSGKLATAVAVPLQDLRQDSGSGHFVAPPAPARPRTRSIQYSKPLDQIEAAREVLEARSAKQVGEMTFDYFYERECNDDV